MITRTKKLTAGLGAATALFLSGCTSDAKVASENLSTQSDNFEIVRRVVFVNGITGEYLLEIKGRCSIVADEPEQQLEVTCKLDADRFKKHFLGLSDNVTYFVEQIDGANVSTDFYEVNFKPSVIIPDVEAR